MLNSGKLEILQNRKFRRDLSGQFRRAGGVTVVSSEFLKSDRHTTEGSQGYVLVERTKSFEIQNQNDYDFAVRLNKIFDGEY